MFYSSPIRYWTAFFRSRAECITLMLSGSKMTRCDSQVGQAWGGPPDLVGVRVLSKLHFFQSQLNYVPNLPRAVAPVTNLLKRLDEQRNRRAVQSIIEEVAGLGSIGAILARRVLNVVLVLNGAATSVTNHLGYSL
jgi:hypothetical protein